MATVFQHENASQTITDILRHREIRLFTAISAPQSPFPWENSHICSLITPRSPPLTARGTSCPAHTAFQPTVRCLLILTARLSEHVKRPDLRTRPSDSRTAKAPDSHTGQPPRPFPRSLYLCHRRARRFGSTWVSNRHSGSKRRLSMTQELRQEKRKEKKRGSSTRS